MSPTRFDHIAKEAGLIEKLPGRSRIMHTKLEVEYEGNLQGLIEFLEATFKDPNGVMLNVTALQKTGLTPREALVRELWASHETEHPSPPVNGWGRSAPTYEKALLAELDNIFVHMKAGLKIYAIKAMREATGSGLKEAKDAVEGPLTAYIARGGV
jgi:ribosomal protein L7/L12